MHWFLVFIGGGIGAVARHGVNRAALVMLGPGFPWSTLLVNVLGSLAMGLLIDAFAAAPAGVSNNLRLFLTTGILGGFTTFSAFSLDALTLWERGQLGLALLYVLASVTISLVAIAAGFFLPRAF